MKRQLTRKELLELARMAEGGWMGALYANMGHRAAPRKRLASLGYTTNQPSEFGGIRVRLTTAGRAALRRACRAAVGGGR